MSEDITQKILLELNLNSENTKQALDDTIKKIVDYSDATQKLKEKLSDLEKTGQKNTEEYKKTSRALDENIRLTKAQTDIAKSYEKQLVNLVKANQSETGSLAQKKAALSAATAEYDRYGTVTKTTSAAAIALNKSILGITDELKAEEKALGNTRRNVGNYAEAIKEANKEAQTLARTLGTNSAEFKKANENLSQLKIGFKDFQKTTDNLDPKKNFSNLSGSINNISNGLGGAVTKLNLFGAASEPVSGFLSGISGGVSTLASAPAILSEAKTAMQAFGIAAKAALGPIGLIAIGIAAVGIAFAAFSTQTTDTTKSAQETQLRYVEQRYSTEVRLLKAAGKEAFDEQLKQLKASEQLAVLNAKRLGAKANVQSGAIPILGIKSSSKGLNEEERAELTKNLADAAEFNLQIRELQIAHNTKIENDNKTSKEVVRTDNKKSNEDILNDQKEADQKFIDAQIEQANIIDERIIAENKDRSERAKSETQREIIEKQTRDQADQANIQNKLTNFAGTFQQELDLKQQLLDLQYQRELEAAEFNEQSKAEINAKYERQTTGLKKQTEQDKLGLTSQALGQAASLFKKNSTAYKTFAIAQATIDTYKGAALALATQPPPFGAIFAGITIAAGLANVAKIGSTPDGGAQFYDGGFTGKGNSKSESTAIGKRPYKYHYNEWVSPAWMVDDPRYSPVIKSLENVRQGKSNSLSHIGGFASGGFTNPNTGQNTFDQYSFEQSIVRFAQNMPSPVVTVEDINAGQQSVHITESRANS